MRRGFTIAEVVVCLGLLSVGLLALVSSILYALRAGEDSTETHTAGVAAASIMCQVRQTLARDFTRSVAVRRQPLPNHAGYEYEVAERAEMGGELKRVEVTIYWKDRQGDRRFRAWTKVIDDAL